MNSLEHAQGPQGVHICGVLGLSERDLDVRLGPQVVHLDDFVVFK